MFKWISYEYANMMFTGILFYKFTELLFRLTCNGDGTMNIHRYGSKRSNEYVLGIVCSNETLQRIAIDKNQIRILYNYWLTADGLTQRRIDDELMENVEILEEELADKPKIELILKECNEVQRDDIRFAKQWITLTFYKHSLINVRMNGNFFSQQLWYMSADTRRRPLDFSREFNIGTAQRKIVLDDSIRKYDSELFQFMYYSDLLYRYLHCAAYRTEK